MINMVLKESSDKMEVMLCQRQEGDKKFFFRVRLRSSKVSMSGPIWTQGDVEVDSKLEKRIQMTGGALAEHQAGTYNNTHDPDECAKEAGKLFINLAKRLKEKGLFG